MARLRPRHIPGFAGGTLEELLAQFGSPPPVTDPRRMNLPASGPVVVGPGGRIEGFGDQRDYAPLSSGYNSASVGKQMGEYLSTLRGPAAEPAGAPVPALPTTAPRVGTETSPNLSPLGQKLAEYRTLQGAHPSSAVKRASWGYEERPPERSPSRGKQALIGTLLGAMQGVGATGNAWGALGGAAAGAISGGVSPALMQEFSRHQELRRLRGDITDAQEIELNNARITETNAQALQRAVMAQMEVYRDPETGEEYTVKGGEAARIAASKDRQKTALAAKTAEEAAKRAKLVPYTDPVTKETVMVDPAEKIRLTQGQRRIDKTSGTRPTRTLNGQIWEKGDDGHWAPAPGSPPPAPRRDIPGEKRTEKEEKRRAKAVQAEKLFRKGHDYWEQAKKKREDAEAIPRGTPNRDERYRTLIREAESLEDQTRKVQQKGDELAAESESATASTNTRTIEGAIEAFRKSQKREPTAEEIARMRNALNRR